MVLLHYLTTNLLNVILKMMILRNSLQEDLSTGQCVSSWCGAETSLCISGQMISGPPRKKRDVAEEVFEAAKK